MKSLIFIVGFVNLFSSLCQAQKNPEMLTTLYVKDSMGNIDSIEIGFDLKARNIINTEFGEIENTEPFDSVLDIKAMNPFSFDIVSSEIRLSEQRVVGPSHFTLNGTCINAGSLFLFIKVKYNPITIWFKDLEEFQKISCFGNNRTIITSNYFYYTVPTEAFGSFCRWQCIKSGPITLNHGSQYYLDTESPFFIEYPSLEKNKDSIYALFLIPNFVNYWCDTIPVGTYDETYTQSNKLFHYPNPVSKQLTIFNPTSETILHMDIYDQNGKKVETIYNGLEAFAFTSIDFEKYATGVYFIQALSKNNVHSITKVIKLE